MFCSIGSVRLGACRAGARRVIALTACFLALVAGADRLTAEAAGPVAAYAFSDSGAIARDLSGNANDATLVGGPIAAPGRFGYGLRLDGIDDAVQLPAAGTLTLTTAFTFEAWIAPAAFGRDRSIWWTPAAMLTLRADGTLMPVAILSGGQVGFIASDPIRLDAWSHVAVTYDGSMLRLFVNGADAGSRIATGTLLPVSVDPAILGGTAAFAGVIDEARLYRRALSATEVGLDGSSPVDPSHPLEVAAQTPAPGAIGVVQTAVAATFSRAIDASSITPSTVELLNDANVAVPAIVTYDLAARTATLRPTISLTPLEWYTVRIAGGGALGVRDALGMPLAADVAWRFRSAASNEAPSAAYSFDSADGSSAADLSGNGNTARLFDGATTTAGRSGNGLLLDGIDAAARLPLSESLAFGAAFTFEAWIAPSAFGRDRSLWWTPAAMVTLRADGTLMPVAILSGGQVGFVSDAALPLGTWSHVAVTYDGSMLRLFVNGAEAGSRAATGTLLAVSPAQPGIVGGASAFAGVLDDVRLYRRGVSAAEIAEDMARPVEPELSFPVDTPPIPQPSAPRITSLNVSPGRGGRMLFVRGRNFGRRRAASTITINGTRASAIAWTNRMILAIVPPAATSGPVVVDVGGRTSNAIAFSVMSLGIADRGRSDRR